MFLGGLVRKLLFTLTDQAAVSMTNFLTSAIVGRSCSKDELGFYSLCFLIAVFMVNSQAYLISWPYTVYSPKLKGADFDRYTTSVLCHQLCLSAVGSAILFGAAWILLRGFRLVGLASVMEGLAAVAIFILLKEFTRQLSFAWLRFQTALALDIAVGSLQIGGLLFLMKKGWVTPSRVFPLAGFACAVGICVWVFAERRRLKFQTGQWTANFKRNWEFGKWQFMGGFANLVGIQAYPWLLMAFHGPSATGVFAVCQGAIFLANPFILGMGNYLGPKIMHANAEGGLKGVHRVVWQGTMMILVVMGIFCIAMFLVGGQVVTLIYGSKYVGHHLTVSILALAQLIEALTLSVGGGLFAFGRPDTSLKSYLLTVAVMLTLGVFLVKHIGVNGVALSLLVSCGAASVYKVLVFVNHSGSSSGRRLER
jgi:O-antigen/teichoic acid export membrane protein